MPALSCRFYRNKFPEIEDVVMVNVRSIAEMGAYVDLSEYNNIEGELVFKSKIKLKIKLELIRIKIKIRIKSFIRSI